MKTHFFNVAAAVAAILTAVLWFVGEIRWPLALLLLLMNCEVVYWRRSGWSERVG
jgi:hypothetical protein